MPFGAADVEVVLPNIGRVTYFSHNRFFEATCFVHGCRFTKKATASLAPKGNPAQGRAIGVLFAWLTQSQHPVCLSAEVHNSRKNKMSICKELRDEGRLLCRACDNGELLLEKERPPRDGEGDEPDRCP